MTTSSTIWRPSSATTVVGKTNGLKRTSFRSIQPQSRSERAFLESNGPIDSESWKGNFPPPLAANESGGHTLPPSPLAQMLPGGLPNHPVASDGQPNRSFYNGQANQLKNQLTQAQETRSARPRSFSNREVTELKQINPLAHDRFASLTPWQQAGVTSFGPLEDLTMLIPKSQGVSNSNARSRLMPQHFSDNIEEVFSAHQPLNGQAKVLGTRRQGEEWYLFGSDVGKKGSKKRHGDAASSWFAPEEYAARPTGGGGKQMGPQKVVIDVQGIMEGPWKGYLQGDELARREHGVQAVHAGPKEGTFQKFQGAYDSVKGVLNTVGSVAKSLQSLAKLAGLATSLGKFGGVLGSLGSLSIPSSPGELISSLLNGSGAEGTKADSTAVASSSAAGTDGVVITTGGAGASAAGEAVCNQIGEAEAGESGSGNGSGSDKSVSKSSTGGEGEAGAKNKSEEQPVDQSKENNEEAKDESEDLTGKENSSQNEPADEGDSGKGNASENEPESTQAGLLGGDQAEIRADPATEADFNRNQYQDGLCPDTEPYWGYKDPETGIIYGHPEYENPYHMLEGEVCHRGSGGVLDNIHESYDQHTNEFINSQGYDPAELDPSVQCCYDLVDGSPGQTSSYDFSSPTGIGDGAGSLIAPLSTTAAQAVGGAHVDLDVAPAVNNGGNYPQVSTSGRPVPPRVSTPSNYSIPWNGDPTVFHPAYNPRPAMQ